MQAFRQSERIASEAETRAKNLEVVAGGVKEVEKAYQFLSQEYKALHEALRLAVLELGALNEAQDSISNRINNHITSLEILWGKAKETEGVSIEFVEEMANLTTLIRNLHVIQNNPIEATAFLNDMDEAVLKQALQKSRHKITL